MKMDLTKEFDVLGFWWGRIMGRIVNNVDFAVGIVVDMLFIEGWLCYF